MPKIMPCLLRKGGLFFTYPAYGNIHVCHDVMAKCYCYDGHKKNESRRLTMSTEQNKANYRRFIEEAWNKGNLDIIEEIASPGVVFHSPPGTPPGWESAKQVIAT